MKKNGFVFVETIVVCSVLTVSLVSIYASFILVLNRQKTRSYYNQSIYNYRAYYVLKTLSDTELQSCDDKLGLSINSTLKNKYSIAEVHELSGDRLTNTSLIGDLDLLAYTKTINASTDDCYYIFVFNNPDSSDENKYYYSYVLVEDTA